MDDYERKNDLAVAALVQRFNDFIERYDRDCGATAEWRRAVEIEIKTHGEILRDISPAYHGSKWIVGLIMIGSIGLAVKAFWSHLAWK